MSFLNHKVEVIAFDTTELSSPSGTRNIPYGSEAYIRSVGTGSLSGIIWPNTTLNLIDSSNKDYIQSTPVAFILRASNSGFGISDIKPYIIDDSALEIPRQTFAIPSGFVQYTISGQWLPFCQLPSGAGTILRKNFITFPFQFPGAYRADGAGGLTGEQDSDVSQYVYMNLILPNGFPFGTYGILGSGLLRLGFLYSYFDYSYLF